MPVAELPQEEKKLKEVILDALSRGASDLYLLPGEPPALRLNGEIVRTDWPPVKAGSMRGLAASLLGGAELDRLGSEVGEISRSLSIGEAGNAWISVARSQGDYTIAIGLIQPGIADVERIRAPDPLLEAALAGSGLIIITGPTGSGKTTTLFSLLDYINERRACLICTVEAPILQRIPPKKAIVQQREIGVDVPNTLAGIQAALRQGLDVLYVAEACNVEEIQACVSAAETGHLVLTVMHASSPEDAVRRAVELIPEDLAVPARCAFADSLRCVTSQILLPSAKSGRTAAYGVLVPDDEMRQAIAEGRDILDRHSTLPTGCRTLAQDILDLQESGAITADTAQRALDTL